MVQVTPMLMLLSVHGVEVCVLVGGGDNLLQQ